MKKIALLLLALCLIAKCYAQTDPTYREVAKDSFMYVKHNDETSTMDTFTINLKKDHTFTFRKRGVEHRGLQMVGEWNVKGDLLTLTNRYPSEKFLVVKVLPYKDSCNGYVPPMINAKGKITENFRLEANHNSYYMDGVIPYAELDTMGKVQICSLISSNCSDWFTIPYKDCYQFMVDMDVDSKEYVSTISRMYFKKLKHKIIWIKVDNSGPIPD